MTTGPAADRRPVDGSMDFLSEEDATVIAIPRGLARAFRAVARKCSAGRPKGPAPPVVLTSRRGRLTLSTTYPDAAVVCEVPCAAAEPETAIVPAEVFDAIDAPGPIEIGADGARGTARWSDQSGPREHSFVAAVPGPRHEPSARPERTAAVPPEFLTALHECGRTAARGPTRYALHRVQVRGKAGRVVGSDGKSALAWGRFRLPFPDDLLVPALPVFGAKDLAAAGDVRVGRTDSHLAVSAGPWTVFLPIDADGRYPDVGGLAPRAAGASELVVADADAEALLSGSSDPARAADGELPVTLVLGPRPVVRADGAAGPCVVPLAASSATGPPVTFAVDRNYLSRALRLGFRVARIAPPGRSVAFADRHRMMFAVTLGGVAPAPTANDAPEAISHEVPSTQSVSGDAVPGPDLQPEGRTVSMKSHETNGHPGGADPPTPPDPLAEAEALKAALTDAAARAGRLVLALKQGRKKTRVLETAWSALRSLDLDPGGRRDR